ncbi:MAG: hypothetical protein AB7P03_00645 [Kofleriaceae bacterium]
MVLRAVLVLGLGGCHVTVQTETTRPGTTERIIRRESPTARPPTIELTDAGRLRFIEPLECPAEQIITEGTTIELARRPNPATFVVGVLAVAAGGLLAVRGAVDDEPGSSPYTWGGLGAIAIGLPFSIGPWIGNTVELWDGPPPAPIQRPLPPERCGERTLPAGAATLTMRDVEVRGTIAPDGTFSVSPYELVDAYEPKHIPTLNISALVDGDPRPISTVIESAALSSHAPAFLAAAELDTNIEPMRVVPGVVAGTLRVSLTTTSAGPAVRVVLPITNQGPGPVSALRGMLSSSVPAIDGRILYVGYLAKNARVVRELLIPVSAPAADSVRGGTLDLAIELRDAHGTAPTTPVRFRGTVLGDAPR